MSVSLEPVAPPAQEEPAVVEEGTEEAPEEPLAPETQAANPPAVEEVTAPAPNKKGRGRPKKDPAAQAPKKKQ